jgi:hypothetical protein
LSALEWPERNTDAPAVISTVPMPIMMKLASWSPAIEFKFKTIWSAWCEVTEPVMDLYQTIYYPDPELPYYRASITGNKIVVEFNAEPKAVETCFDSILNDFGILYGPAHSFRDIKIKEQKYGKLLPIDDSARRRFIVAMTDEYRIYSIGRFATWRQILMDDVVSDAARLDKWISDREGGTYTRRLEEGR